MSFLKNSAYLTIANFVLLISAYVLNIWVGRNLGPGLYGTYVTVIGVLAILNVMINSESKAISKVVAEDKRSAADVTRWLLRFEFPVLIALALIYYFIVAGSIANVLGDESMLFHLQLLAIVFPIFGLTVIYSGHLAGSARFGLLSLNMVLIGIVKIVLVIALTLLFGVSGAILAAGLAVISGVMFGIFVVRVNPFGKFSEHIMPKVKKIFRLLVPMMGTFLLLVVFSQLGIFLSKRFLESADLVGFFGAAKSISQIPISLFGSLSALFLTTVSMRYSNSDAKTTRDELRPIFKYVLMVLIPAVVVMSASSESLLQILYGSKFASASPILAIIAPGVGFFILSVYLVMILNAIGRPMMTVLGLAVMISVHLLAGFQAGNWGMNAVAISYVLACATGLIFLYIVTYRRLGNIFDVVSLIKVLMVGFVMFYVLEQITVTHILPFVALMAVTGFAYLAVLFAIRELSKDDVRYVKGLLRRKAHPKNDDP